MKHISVLISCYNRKEKTIDCLKSFYEALDQSNYKVLFEIFLVDDGSTDGTGNAVRTLFPAVHVLEGNGHLYWGGGMRLAWEAAMKKSPDAYLWLNDDLLLLPNAIESLLSTAISIRQKEGCEGIIVGSCYAADTGIQTYGGKLRKNEEIFVTPTDYPQQCEMINGNIVLIPRNVSERIGNISKEFIHFGGDTDYGLRAIKAGFKVWVAPGFHAICDRHPDTLWANPNFSLNKRLKYLHSTKGKPPYEAYIFARRHGGLFWPLDLIKLYLLVFFPRLYGKVKQFVKSKWLI